MKKPKLQQRSCKLLALSALALLGSLTNAFGVLNITFSPIEGSSTTFLMQASGSGSTTVSGVNTGNLSFSGFAMNGPYAAIAGAGLSYGGENLTNPEASAPNGYLFTLADTLAIGGPYSFAGGSAIFSLGTTAYTSAFIAGTYSITGSNGIFGDSATGTFTILSSPVPEPSSFALLAGMFGLTWVILRRRA